MRYAQRGRYTPAEQQRRARLADGDNIHLAPGLADFAEENKAWLRLYRLPAYKASGTGLKIEPW